MLQVLQPIQNLIQLGKVRIDGRIFRLHYSFTVIALLTFCVLITTKQYVGDPVICSRIVDVPDSVVNTYCWIHGTYTLSNVSKLDIYPGVRTISKQNDELKYHAYYQWVCFVLFLQSIMFYVPHWLWVQVEGGVIQSLCSEINSISEEKDRRMKNRLIVEYLVNNMGYHDCYVLKYLVFELLTFVNVVGQMFLLDRLLNREFFRYGLDIIQYGMGKDKTMVDPMTRIFPRVSKCTYFTFGSSGSIKKLDALCILPLNAVSEKIFVFLWFWFIILGFLTAVLIVYRSVTAASVKIRFYALAMRFCPVRRTHLQALVYRLTLGDWFFIYLLGQNIDGFRFNEIIIEYLKAINSRNKATKS